MIEQWLSLSSNWGCCSGSCWVANWSASSSTDSVSKALSPFSDFSGDYCLFFGAYSLIAYLTWKILRRLKATIQSPGLKSAKLEIVLCSTVKVESLSYFLISNMSPVLWQIFSMRRWARGSPQRWISSACRPSKACVHACPLLSSAIIWISSITATSYF